MALVTGTPVGNLTQQEDVFLEGAPTVYFQDATANPLNNPDADGFYWGLSGTTSYPAYQIGCLTDVSLADNLTINDVLCDNVGVKSTIQQRNYIEFVMSVQSFFPLTVLRHILKGGAVTETAPTEKFGFGQVNNNVYWMVYAPKVYDTDVGDYVWQHFHRCQFVDAWTINMTFGTPWQATGVRLRAFVDENYPAAQQFGMWGRADASVIT
jgi:hypothetical protein